RPEGAAVHSEGAGAAQDAECRGGEDPAQDVGRAGVIVRGVTQCQRAGAELGQGAGWAAGERDLSGEGEVVAGGVDRAAAAKVADQHLAGGREAGGGPQGAAIENQSTAG